MSCFCWRRAGQCGPKRERERERERDQIKTQFWFTLGTCWLFSKPRRNQNHAAPVFYCINRIKYFWTWLHKPSSAGLSSKMKVNIPTLRLRKGWLKRKLAKFCRFLGQQSLVRSDLSYRGPGLTLATKGLTPASKGLTPATKGLTPATKGLAPATKGLTPAVWPLQLRAWPLQLRVWPLQLRVWPLQLRVWPLQSRVWPLQLRVWPLQLREVWPLQLREVWPWN